MQVTYDELKNKLKAILLSRHVSEDKAEACATIFADTTASGVYSHGVNRFPVFIRQLDAGHIIPQNDPKKILSLGAIERWDGQRGIGNLNAEAMMKQATKLADEFGIGLVALKNTNHWMRGGHYGWQAAKRGYIGICWTNSLAVMPPWGAKEPRIGTNPLCVAVPGEEVTLVDMSMSMFSYGALQNTRLAGNETSVDAGFDDNGNPTRNPEIIEKNRRIMPTGFWKGSSLSIVLDQLATLLSGGLSVAGISAQDDEYNVSQIFIAIALEKLIDVNERDIKLKEIKDYIMSAALAEGNSDIRLPGHHLEQKIKKHHQDGIPVDDRIWETITQL